MRIEKFNYVVTGGAGFIGSHVIDELLKRDDINKIFVIDKLGMGSDMDNIADDEDKLEIKESKFKKFENNFSKYLGVKNSYAVANCSNALDLCAMLINTKNIFFSYISLKIKVVRITIISSSFI